MHTAFQPWVGLCLITVAAGGLACSPKSTASSPEGDGRAGDEWVEGDGDAMTGDELACTPFPLSLFAPSPRLMILLDQASSMTADSWLPGESRWQQAQAAIATLVTAPENQSFAFGLDAFPDGTLEYLERCYDACCADPICFLNEAARCTSLAAGCNRRCAVDLPPIVPLAPASVAGPEIIDYMDLPYVPASFSSTPLVAQMSWYAAGQASVSELYAGDALSYLLILSDGDDTCVDGGDEPDIPAIVSQLGDLTQQLYETHGIRTIAVGFGDTSGSMAAELNAIAANGGTEFTSVLLVDEPGDLQTALDRIADSLRPCERRLESPQLVTDPSLVRVLGDGIELTYDESCTNGWRWQDGTGGSELRIEICGPACESLRSGELQLVTAEAACTARR